MAMFKVLIAVVEQGERTDVAIELYSYLPRKGDSIYCGYTDLFHEVLGVSFFPNEIYSEDMDVPVDVRFRVILRA